MFDRDSLLRKAELLRRQKRFKEAEREISVVLQTDPEDVEALIILGHCKIDTKLYNEAITILKQCLQYDSNKDYIFYLIAFAYYQKNENDTALSYLKDAFSIFPFNAGYFALGAHINLEKKEYQKALELADDGLALDATNVSCLNARSTALFRLKKKEEAYETINEALSIDPENFITHTNYGWHYLERGKHKEAATHFREALRINPNYGYAKQGYKAALKSKLIFYRWLLQANLWMSLQKKNFRLGLLIGIWFIVLLVDSISDSARWHSVGLVVVVLYIAIALFSWLGNSMANLYLLTTKHRQYILDNQEKWAARLVGISLLLSIALYFIIHAINDNYLFVAAVVAGMAIPLSGIEIPFIPFNKANKRTLINHLILSFGFLCCLTAPLSITLSTFCAILFAVFFLGYMWTGTLQKTIQ